MNEFKLKAPYKPTGDQPQAIAELVEGFKEGNQFETLLGVTGSKNRWYFVVCGWRSRCCGSGESIGEKRVDEEVL